MRSVLRRRFGTVSCRARLLHGRSRRRTDNIISTARPGEKAIITTSMGTEFVKKIIYIHTNVYTRIIHNGTLNVKRDLAHERRRYTVLYFFFLNCKLLLASRSVLRRACRISARGSLVIRVKHAGRDKTGKQTQYDEWLRVDDKLGTRGREEVFSCWFFNNENRNIVIWCENGFC